MGFGESCLECGARRIPAQSLFSQELLRPKIPEMGLVRKELKHLSTVDVESVPYMRIYRRYCQEPIIPFPICYKRPR
jgi:hypothetical protein